MGTMKRKMQIGVSILFCLLLGLGAVGKIKSNMASPILHRVGDFFVSNFRFSRQTAQKQHPSTKA